MESFTSNIFGINHLRFEQQNNRTDITHWTREGLLPMFGVGRSLVACGQLGEDISCSPVLHLPRLLSPNCKM